MEETVSGFVSGADALRRARDGGRRDAAPVASRAPDDARSTERRTCMTGMSMTVFIPLMPRTVVSVMVPGKSTDRSPRERKDRTRSVRVTRAARAASARLSVRRGGARGEVSLARRGRGGRRKSAQMTGVGAYATGLSWRVRRERCGTAQSGRQRVCPYETRSLLCHCIDTPIDANSQKTNSETSRCARSAPSLSPRGTAEGTQRASSPPRVVSRDVSPRREYPAPRVRKSRDSPIVARVVRAIGRG